MGTLVVCGLMVISAAAAVPAETCCPAGAAGCTTTRTATPAPDNTLTAQEADAGWILLFDGKTLNGWACTDPNSKAWVVENGTIFYNLQGGGYLYTPERYGDFELKLDFRVDKGTNSGLFFRWDNLGDPVQTGIEMQILDSYGANPPSKHDCGAIYDVLAPRKNPMKPALEWNTVTLRCSDNYISITMNGERMLDMDLNKWTQPHRNPDGSENKFGTAYKDMAREGHIGLQEHGGKFWVRNTKIRPLD